MFKWINRWLSPKKETPTIIQGSFLKYEDALNKFEEEHGEYYVETPDVPYSDGWVGRYDPVDTVNGYEEDWTYG
jgi:hypothetical protein